MSAKDTVRGNKTAILTTLCGDYRLILNKVYEKKLVTQREYNNLKSINREDVEGHVNELVDKIMNKEEDTCQDFLNLLQTDEDVKTTFPNLKNILKNDTCLLPRPVQATRSDDSGVNQRRQTGSPSHVSMDAQRVDNSPQSTQAMLSVSEMQFSYKGEHVYSDAEPNMESSYRYNEANYYTLTHNPRGVCMVINNGMFLGTELKNRGGIQADARALHSVFTRLGFKVEIHNDLTAEAMRRELKKLGERNFMDDDALVVCILSVGEKGFVFGTDVQRVSLQELTRPFKSGQAPSLAGKPKLFFIEVSQGSRHQRGSLKCPPRPREQERDRPAAELPYNQVRFDHLAPGPGSDSRQNCLEEDAAHVSDKAGPWDFLLCMATMPEGMSYQNRFTGCIYTQELCRQLIKSAESSEDDDILTVLTRVNGEISRGEYQNYEQMPEYKSTLTKKLVLKFVSADCNQVQRCKCCRHNSG